MHVIIQIYELLCKFQKNYGVSVCYEARVALEPA
jgi:hypothetical protein